MLSLKDVSCLLFCVISSNEPGLRAIGLNVFLSLIAAFFVNLAISYATLPVSEFPSLVHLQYDSCILQI